MKSLRLHLPARLITVAVLMISWFIATNHCAFGMMNPTSQSKVEHARCCSGKAAPSKNAPADGPQCCQALKSLMASKKVEAKADVAKALVSFSTLLFALVCAQTDEPLAGSEFQHGPPRVVSFAESVLQRSLLSHAPPFEV